MRAAAFDEPGGPDVFGLMEIDTPHSRGDQVRVRVRAAGVQPYECAVRAGWTAAGAPAGYPRIPGNEFAGVVDEVGDEVTGVRPGAEVIGYGTLNAYAEYIVVPADQVTAKPAGMPWEVAGGFSAGAQTAHIAIGELAVGEGDTLVIHGAAGSVGTVAVQLAVARGATVLGTARAANHDYLRELGAVPIAYGEGLGDALAPYAIDAALDGAGGDALTVSLAVVADRKRILTLVEHERAEELGIRVTPNARSAARLAELAEMYARGALRIHVRAAYPLARAADAHRDVGSGHGRGKVVVTVP